MAASARSRARRAAGALVALGLAAAGCDAGPAPEPEAPSSAPPQPPPAATAPPALPAPGQLELSVEGGRVQLAANRVLRLRVLRELSRAAGFELELERDARLGDPVTLHLGDGRTEEVLEVLLDGHPYSVHYEVGAERRRRLARVRVGAGGAPPAPVARAPAIRAGPPGRPAGEAQTRALRELSDPDPEVRAEAAAWIYPDPEAVAALGGLLRSDPAPEVRAAAAEGLGQALEDPEAVDALLAALQDRDSVVVIAALEGLEFVGDETLVSEISFLLRHPDPAVRDAADQAMDWLGEE